MRKVSIFIALLVGIGGSFIFGRLTVQWENAGPKEITDETVLEVMNDLLDNHYSQPSKEQLLQGAIDGMIASLDDPHTSYFDAESYEQFQAGFSESYVGVGISVIFSNNMVVVEEVKSGGPADNAGIRPNDIIAYIDGVDVTDGDYYKTLSNIIGDVGTDVTIGVIRYGVPGVIYLTMTRAIIDNSTVTFTTYTKDDSLIGYIKVNTFGDETYSKFHDAISSLESQGIDSLIVDLRDNGGGHLNTVISMLNEFLVHGEKPMFSTEYYVTGEYHIHSYYASNTEKKAYNIVTLVNEYSASASEVFASAMQENGLYTLFGTQTYGKGTMQTDYPIRTTESDRLHISFGKWITADGNWVDQHGGTSGVTPDIVVNQNVYETAYKLFLLDGETFTFNEVDTRIQDMQYILNIMGYDVREDGFFDVATQEAIRNIQAIYGMSINGIVDNDVLAILNTSLDAYKTNPENDSQLSAAIDYLVANPTHD